MRINRFLAAAGFGSRRACEQLVLDGKVSVNGHFHRDLATQVEPGDDVRVSGKPVKVRQLTYLLVNKPRGYVSTRSDERDRKTVFDLVPRQFGNLFHVGRLDKDSEGILLLTNDGSLSHKLAHPTHQVDKEYEVLIDKPLDPEHQAKLVRGFHIEGGRAKMEKVRIIAPRHISVILRQGLKRQIRLMLYRLGYEVNRLVRVRIGSVTIEKLPPGAWRQLTAKEIEALSTAKKKPASKPKPRAPRPKPAK